MNEIDDLLEHIRITELQNPENQYLSSSSIFLGKSYIALSSEFAGSTKKIRDLTNKTLKPGFFVKVFFGIVIIFFFGMFAAVGEGGVNPGMVIVFLVLMLIIGRLWYLLFSKQFNYSITINKEGIVVNETEYKWTDIKATAILYLPIRRGGAEFLVLVFHDNSYKKFDLSNFVSFEGFKKTISGYLEYFKPYRVL